MHDIDLSALARDDADSVSVEALIDRNITSAEHQLSIARARFERADKRVRALEAVVDHWRVLELEYRRRQDLQSNRCCGP
jgi:hypothetical protein